MKPPPDGWPRIASGIFYEEAAAAIDWLCRVFGFEVRLRIEGEGGRIEHSELTFGEGLIMVGDVKTRASRPGPSVSRSPKSLDGANTQTLCVCVDDVDEHCAKARAGGATIVDEPTTHDYGEDYWSDRTYRAVDLEGHQWWFLQRLR
ncbi:MAG: VOC family protein [Planctomycetota bacterium]